MTDVSIFTSTDTNTTVHTFRESPDAAITENDPVLSVFSSAFLPPSVGVSVGAALLFWLGFTSQSAGFPLELISTSSSTLLPPRMRTTGGFVVRSSESMTLGVSTLSAKTGDNAGDLSDFVAATFALMRATLTDSAV